MIMTINGITSNKITLNMNKNYVNELHWDILSNVLTNSCKRINNKNYKYSQKEV